MKSDSPRRAQRAQRRDFMPLKRRLRVKEGSVVDAFVERGELLTDARLDELAERFLARGLRTLLKISFEQYLCNPDRWDTVADHLVNGGGIQASGKLGVLRLVMAGGQFVNVSTVN